MKLKQWLDAATAQLQSAGIGTARLDALILLEDVLKKDRSYLLAHQQTLLSITSQKRLDAKLKKRCQQIPMAYIRGFCEFYGRRFRVNRHVLQPRPESETMIDLLKQLRLSRPVAIADVGTGSGCLGITAALEIKNSTVDLLDIDAGALAVAKYNVNLHELSLKTAKKDLLGGSHGHYNVILANLPYVPDSYHINPAAATEPKIAIFGGKDGLDLYRRLFTQISQRRHQPTFVLTESLPPQHAQLNAVAAQAGYRLLKTDDFIQVFKKV